MPGEPFDASRILGDLLTFARQSDCGCNACVELRSLWTELGVDDAVRDQAGEVPRPGNVCVTCWEAPQLEHVRKGGAGLATLPAGAGRCAMCGLPVGDPGS